MMEATDFRDGHDAPSLDGVTGRGIGVSLFNRMRRRSCASRTRTNKRDVGRPSMDTTRNRPPRHLADARIPQERAPRLRWWLAAATHNINARNKNEVFSSHSRERHGCEPGTGCAEKAFRAGGGRTCRGAVTPAPVLRGQSFDLFDVEHGVTLEEVDVAGDFDAAVVVGRRATRSARRAFVQSVRSASTG